MDPKKLWQSKTFWINAATAAVALGGGSFGIDVPPKVAVPMVAVANILLRILTKQPVTFTF